MNTTHCSVGCVDGERGTAGDACIALELRLPVLANTHLLLPRWLETWRSEQGKVEGAIQPNSIPSILISEGYQSGNKPRPEPSLHPSEAALGPSFVITVVQGKERTV